MQHGHHLGFLWEQEHYLKLCLPSEQRGGKDYTHQWVRNSPLPKNVPVQTAQLDGKTFKFPSLQQGNLLASIPPCACVDHASSSQLQDSDNVFWTPSIPASYYGWEIKMRLPIYNAFIFHKPMNQRWCHGNSLCCNCKIEIRLPVGGKVAGSSILLSDDSKMAPPGQLLQAIMVSVSCVHIDRVQSLT